MLLCLSGKWKSLGLDNYAIIKFFMRFIACVPMILYSEHALSHWPVSFDGWRCPNCIATATVERPAMTNQAANPCYGQKSCHVQAILKIPDNGKEHLYAFNGLSWGSIQGMTSVRTVGEVERIIANYTGGGGPLPRTATTNQITSGGRMKPGVLCMVYSVPGLLRVPWPGSEVCSYAPPPDVTCSLKPDYIRLDHGVIEGDAINGSATSTTAVVQCSETMSLKIRSTSGGIVNLGKSGIRSIITVNGVTGGGQDIKATPSGTALEIKSTLSVKGEVVEGIISGSDVIVIALD